MKRFVLMMLLCSIPAQARWLKFEESSQIIEKLYVDYEVRQDGTFTETFELVLRVLTEDAKTSSGTSPIEYDALTDEIEVIEAYTLNGKKKSPVDPTKIVDRDAGDSRAYDNMKVRNLVFPHVQVGSALHLKYRLKNKKPLIAGRWSANLNFPILEFVKRLKVRVRSELPLFYEFKDPSKFLKIKQIGKNELELHNVKMLPGSVYGEKDPFFHPANQSEIWISTQKDWVEFFKDFSKSYEETIQQPLPAAVKPWLKAAAKKKTEAEKVVFLLETLSRYFRYFGDWRRIDGGYKPRSLAEIEKSRYGDCKDLSTFLVALLRNLKIEAHVAVVKRGENPWVREPDYNLPSVTRFNHAIVRAVIKGKTYWLDPTNPVGSLEAFADIRGRPAYVLNASGGFMDRLPEVKVEDAERTYSYEYSFKPDHSVAVRMDADYKRLAAFDLAHELMTSSRPEVLSEILEDATEGGELVSHKFTNEPKSERMLKDIKFGLDYIANGIVFNAGKSSFFIIPDGVSSGAFYETDGRESDLELGFMPYRVKVLRRLKNVRMVQAAPPPCTINSEWMSLQRKVSAEGSDVVISQIVELRRPFITKAEFRSPSFKQLQAATRKCSYRQGILIEPLKVALSSPKR